MYFYNNIPIQMDITEERRQQILSQFPPPELPIGDSNFDLESESAGNRVHVRLLLNDFQIQMTRTNKEYLKITLSNNAGTIQAKMWDNQGQVKACLPLLEKYTIFDVQAKVDEFNGHKSLTIEQLNPCDEDMNPFSLLPYTKQDMESLTLELFSYIDELDTPFKNISYGAMNRFWEQFRIRPAAKGFHHNYLGGLLKHTVGLMRFARYILKFENDPFKAIMKLIQIVEKAHKKELWEKVQSNESPQRLIWKDTIDHLYQMFYGMIEHKESIPSYNIIITSILFHDIGKLLEYDHAGKTFETFQFLFPSASSSHLNERKQAGITMDELGVMVGHIPYGFLILTKIIEKEEIDLPLDTIHEISHCILCHHGLPEWGSAVKYPQTIDGFIVHIVDYLDSRYENTEAMK